MMTTATPRRSRFMPAVLAACFVLMSAATLEPDPSRLVAYVRTNGGKSLPTAFVDVSRHLSRCVVSVQCAGDTRAIGTVVDARHVITKASMMRKGQPITCRLPDGSVADARIVGRDDDLDLVLLEVEAEGLRTAPWGTSEELEAGRWVVSVGRRTRPVAVGVVSVPKRAVPARSGYLGVQIEDARDGVRVVQVVPGTAASRAGLEIDDVVRRVGGSRVRSREQLIERISSQKAGSSVTLELVRDGRVLSVDVRLGGRGDPKSRLFHRGTSERRAGFPAALQHDTVLTPTQCGGPLVDLGGRVVGINIARSGRTESLALPAETVRPVVRRMLARAKGR